MYNIYTKETLFPLENSKKSAVYYKKILLNTTCLSMQYTIVCISLTLMPVYLHMNLFQGGGNDESISNFTHSCTLSHLIQPHLSILSPLLVISIDLFHCQSLHVICSQSCSDTLSSQRYLHSFLVCLIAISEYILYFTHSYTPQFIPLTTALIPNFTSTPSLLSLSHLDHMHLFYSPFLLEVDAIGALHLKSVSNAYDRIRRIMLFLISLFTPCSLIFLS